MRNKTEEVEKLKLEIKDLKEILKLKENLKENGLEESVIEKDTNNESNPLQSKSNLQNMHKQQKGEQFTCEDCDFFCASKGQLNTHVSMNHSIRKEEEVFNCNKCAFQCTTKPQLNKHITLKHSVKEPRTEYENETRERFTCQECNFSCSSKAKLIMHNNRNHSVGEKEEQFNCDVCAFQGTTKLQLNKHINLKHSVEGQGTEDVLKCKNCGEQFSEKWNLMIHRKIKHLNTVAYCKNKIAGNCPFTSKMCWWKHDDVQNREAESIKCYIYVIKLLKKGKE